MTMNNSIQQMHENFEAQFEVGADGRYLYRRNQKGEPIPVSADERERFIRQYKSRIRAIMGGMVAALLASVGLVIWWTVATNSELPDVLLYVGIGAIAIAAIALMYWVQAAPAREIGGRAPIGRERTKEEMRAIFFKKISYGQLAGAAALGAVLPFMQRSGTDVFHGWARLWLVFGGLFVLLAGVQGVRKWRFERKRL
jgi:hypothetical protein